MFAAFVRAALNLLAGALIGALVDYTSGFIAPLLGEPNDLLRQSFTAIGDYAILFGILAALVTLLARANIERRLGGA